MQARRFKALHIVTHGMGSLVLQRGLSNALLVPGTAHGEEAGQEGLGACKPCADLLRNLANGGVRLTITLVTPEMDHASLNIMCNNLGSLCPINLYCTRSDNKGQAGCYSWGLPGSVGHNHACHFYLHTAVKTIKSGECTVPWLVQRSACSCTSMLAQVLPIFPNGPSVAAVPFLTNFEWHARTNDMQGQ